ncbi:MAG: ATP-binding protein [Blastocatellia bacterium]
MPSASEKTGNGKRPHAARVDEAIEQLNALPENQDLARRAAEAEGAIAFIHFDPSAVKSQIVQALVHSNDLMNVHRGMYVHIVSTKDKRRYSGRIVEGPFYNPDALKRDSTPVQFIILNQGQGKVLAVPEYHGWVQIEILGEERNGSLSGATRRPHPASPVLSYDETMMTAMLNLGGNIRMGRLDNYDSVFVQIDGDNKGVVPRNWLTVGTIGSGKTNTCQVFIEETLAAGYAQIVVDPEGEYIFMDQPSGAANIGEDLKPFERAPRGVASITVYRPPLAESRRDSAIEFSVPFDSLSPEIVMEITEMNTAQQTRFTFLYEQAIQIARKQKGNSAAIESEDIDLSMGYPGITLAWLLKMLEQEFQYYNWKKRDKKAAKPKRKASDNDEANVETDGDAAETGLKIYCHKYQLEPLIQDAPDVASFGALRKKLRELQMMRIFDRKDAPPLNVLKLSEPGHLSVIDMSDSREQQVVNIVIADLLARMYHYKMGLSEEANTERRVFLTIEEAHGFVSREKQDRMEQTLDQLRRIARRGRKRWLALHFVTQSPQHLPSELFELANNKIIHQTTGAENLRVLKAAAGTVNEAIWEDVPSLGKGRAIMVSSQYPHPLIVQIRPASSKRNYMI